MRGGRPCGQCKGRGMGKQGQGRGGLAPEAQTATGFKTERAKVHIGRGKIIGQFLIDGEQVKGDVSSPLGKAIEAGEREASDLIHRDRIPRQYHKAVKGYFSTLQRDTNGATAGGETDEKSTGTDSNDGAGE